MRALIFYPLAWLLDAGLADAIVGDLEELRARRARRSRASAAIFFWRAGLGLILHAMRGRVIDAARGLMRSFGGSHGTGGDVRHALRSVRRQPGFAATAIVLLALGIGANTAVFSIVRGVMLRPLPYHRPDSLVFLWGTTHTDPDNKHKIMTGTHVHEIATHTRTLESFAAFKSWEIGLDGAIDLLRPDGAERLRGVHVTANFFELLGVSAAIGRTFTSSDTEAVPAAVISHRLWQQRFGANTAVLGTRIAMASGRSSRSKPAFTIVGVLPAEFDFTYPREAEVYLLMPWTRIAPERALEYGIVARMRPGVGPAQVADELSDVPRSVLLRYGIEPADVDKVLRKDGLMVEPVREHLVAPVRTGITILAAVAALVLLIACVNLGLLMVSRTIDRTGELAVRAALGAGPTRLARLLVVEGATIAALGGAAGIALAYLVQPAIRLLIPSAVPRADEIAIDTTVLTFALCATVLTALVCGLTPGLVVMRRDLLAPVRRAGTTATASRGLVLARMLVVGVQVAVVLLLLVGAGLLLHSFWRLQRVPLGFDADDVLTFETRLLSPKYRSRQARVAFEQDLLGRVQQLPGVAAASTATAVPMRGVDFVQWIGPRGGRERWGNARTVGPGYFEIMRIPLVRGRLFQASDTAGAPAVVVVSEAYGRAHFGPADPIGRRFAMGKLDLEIVGVVKDVRYSDVDRQAAPAYYLPSAQHPSELVCLLVRPQPGMRAEVAAALRDVVRSIDPEQPIQDLTSIGEIVASSSADRRFYAFSTGMFAAVALLLAVGGLFGVVSRSVAERRREIAIRVALGADRRTVVRLVLALGLMPVVVGSLAGILLAQAGSRSLEALLFEITPADPLAYGAAAALVIGIGTVACLIPARRALRLHPMTTLRSE